MKRLLIVCTLLLAIIGARAQSELGEWMTLQHEEEADVALMIGMYKDKSCIIKTITEVNDEEVGTINVCADAEGTYTRKGNELRFYFKDVRVYVGDIEWSDNIKQKYGNDPDNYNKLKDVFEQAIEEDKGEFVDAVKDLSSLTILSIDGDSMTVKDEGDTVTFRRVK